MHAALSRVDAKTHADGTFLEDWEYVAGSGDLDECNGIIIDGTYAYFLTGGFPYVPRCLNGESIPDNERPAGAIVLI